MGLRTGAGSGALLRQLDVGAAQRKRIMRRDVPLGESRKGLLSWGAGLSDSSDLL
jgi:hypothetical protein